MEGTALHAIAPVTPVNGSVNGPPNVRHLTRFVRYLNTTDPITASRQERQIVHPAWGWPRTPEGNRTRIEGGGNGGGSVREPQQPRSRCQSPALVAPAEGPSNAARHAVNQWRFRRLSLRPKYGPGSANRGPPTDASEVTVSAPRRCPKDGCWSVVEPTPPSAVGQINQPLVVVAKLAIQTECSSGAAAAVIQRLRASQF